MSTQKTNTKTVELKEASEAVVSAVGQDLKNSVLIVSMVANLFVFTLWLVLQVTSQYDASFAQLLFNH
jgi:hypothetical protein